MNFDFASERLTFTKLAETDWELFRSIHSDIKLNQHIRTVQSDVEIRKVFESEIAPWSLHSSHWLTWIIREKESTKQVGLISIVSQEGTKRVAEVGFILLEMSQGKGYATEAVRRVTDFMAGTFGFEKFIAVCSEEHLGSRRVLEKSGMKLDEIIPENTEIKPANSLSTFPVKVIE